MGNGTSTGVVVTVLARPGTEGRKIDWDFDCRAHPPGKARKQGDSIVIDGPDPADITFDLDDSSGFKLKFKEAGAEAIWIGGGSGCPQGPGNGNGEFTIDPNPGPRRLVIRDQISGNGEFHYCLWFDGTDGPEPYDPIIINRR